MKSRRLMPAAQCSDWARAYLTKANIKRAEIELGFDVTVATQQPPPGRNRTCGADHTFPKSGGTIFIRRGLDTSGKSVIGDVNGSPPCAARPRPERGHRFAGIRGNAAPVVGWGQQVLPMLTLRLVIRFAAPILTKSLIDQVASVAERQLGLPIATRSTSIERYHLPDTSSTRF